MKNRSTPKPGSVAYNPEKPQYLNIPEYHSSTDNRNSFELPAIENLNDELEMNEPWSSASNLSKSDSGSLQAD